MPFYGYNRSGAKISEGVRESFWLQGIDGWLPCLLILHRGDFRDGCHRGLTVAQAASHVGTGPASCSTRLTSAVRLCSSAPRGGALNARRLIPHRRVESFRGRGVSYRAGAARYGPPFGAALSLACLLEGCVCRFQSRREGTKPRLLRQRRIAVASQCCYVRQSWVRPRLGLSIALDFVTWHFL
jgi:hypothetical protein